MTVDSEERIFTCYVRAIIENDRPDDRLDRVLDRLRLWLRWELQKRGMWNKPPFFLGIWGHIHWYEGGSAGSRTASAGQTLDALHELTQIAYMDLFIDRKRMASLVRYFRNTGKVDGLVRARLRQLIHERQKKHTHRGTRIFRWLRSAVEAAVREGAIFVESGGLPAARETVLCFGRSESADGPDPALLLKPVRRWNDDLFIDVLVAQGRKEKEKVDELQAKLMELPNEGIHTFRFGDLVDAFEGDILARQRILQNELRPGSAQLHSDQTEDPEAAEDAHRRDVHRQESRPRFKSLDKCVEQGIRAAQGQKRSRESMREIWRLLGAWAHVATDSPRSLDDEQLTALLDLENLPGYRALGRALDIPHMQVKNLLERLKPLIADCLDASTASRFHLPPKAPAGNLASASPHNISEHPVDEQQDFKQQLLEKTLKAFADGEASAKPKPAGESRLGELLFLGKNREVAVEWLVLEEELGHALVFPVDAHGWAGTDDHRLSSPELGELTVHLGLGFWLPLDRLPSERGPWVDVSEIKQAYGLWLDGSKAADDRAWEDSADADYRAWIHELDHERSDLCRGLNGRLDRPTESPEASSNVVTLAENRQETASATASGSVGTGTIGADVNRASWWQIAAMLLLTTSAALVGGMTYQQMRLASQIAQYEATQEELEARNRELGEQLENQEEKSRVELETVKAEADAARRSEREDFEARIQKLRSDFERRLAQVDLPEVIASALFIPSGFPRGPEKIELTDPNQSILFQIEAENGEVVRLVEWPGGKEIYRTTVTGLDPSSNFSVSISGRLLTQGQYRLLVERDGKVVTRFPFEIWTP